MCRACAACNMVPLSSRSGANAHKRPSADSVPHCEEQRRTAPAFRTRQCASRGGDYLYRDRVLRRSRAAAVYTSFNECHSITEASTKSKYRSLGEQSDVGRPPMTKHSELYACLYVKEFPAQVLLRLRPNLREKPSIVMEGEPPLQQVCSLNRKAGRLGVSRGMTQVEVDTFP